jgi:hypothetical protein
MYSKFEDLLSKVLKQAAESKNIGITGFQV